MEISDEKFTVKFKVGKIIFSNETTGYTVISASKIRSKDCSHKELLFGSTLTGTYFNIKEDDVYEADASFLETSKYGIQIKTTNPKLILPSSVEGIRLFLLHHVKGVGKETADRIIEKYGQDTFEAIKNDYMSLTKIKGINKSKAELIYQCIISNEELESLGSFLSSYGITNFNDIVKIHSRLKSNCIEQIKNNPYCICELVSYSYMKISDIIANNMGFLPNCKERLECAVLSYLHFKVAASGYIYVPEKELKKNLDSYVAKLSPLSYKISDSEIDLALSYLNTDAASKIMIDKNENGECCIYLNNMYNNEIEVSRIFKKLGSKILSADNSKVLEFVEYYQNKNPGIIIDKEQIEAIEKAYHYSLSILTGGPGVGKTFTINLIVSFFIWLNKNTNILLAAPTGRAAKRMTEASGYKYEAYTLHRLLGLNGTDVPSIDSIEADVLIVDESSMIDIYLMKTLLETVENSDPKLRFILCGDADQLPSVGPGKILRDIIESDALKVTKLVTLHRQAIDSQINQNCRKILNGKTSHTGVTTTSKVNDFFFIRKNSIEHIYQCIKECISTFLNKDNCTIDNICVLSPMRKGALGIIELNKQLQMYFNPQCPQKKEIEKNGVIFREGDKVMQITNNYNVEWLKINKDGVIIEQGMGIFNGDCGKIVDINLEAKVVTVDFSNDDDTRQIVEYNNSSLSELEHSYAMTVHKSQGCEFPYVIMPFEAGLINYNRSILYTGISRAKVMWVGIGSLNVFDYAIGKVDNNTRYSLLKERLLEAS